MAEAKKIVVKVTLHCQKCEKQVLKIAAQVEGVDSVSLDRKNSKLTTIGNSDPVCLLSALRKFVVAEIISVGAAKEPTQNLAKLRRFNRDEMISATQNFSSIIGHGGFGSVFHGTLRNVGEIAVKVLSVSSKQGKPEFLNELDLLSKVNHKNLVTVIGYCDETDGFMIVYEYMCKGSLADYLHGSKSKSSELNWRCRLQIALDVAIGLEYLHIYCKPKIIHRDLKPSNILLNNNFNGKLSDFGVSKALMEEASSVTTNVKGTQGYLDPMYWQTSKLTKKTDIYSFGVVLLEIVFGRKPTDIILSEDDIGLCEWVINQIANDNESQEYMEKFIPSIDDRIRNQVTNMESMMLVIKLAVDCIQDSSSKPSASRVVKRLKKALKQETLLKNPNTKTLYRDILLMFVSIFLLVISVFVIVFTKI